MAETHIRFFKSPKQLGEGTVMAVGIGGRKIFDRYSVTRTLKECGVVVTELAVGDYVHRDEHGLRPSERELLIQPPLTTEQIEQVGRAACSIKSDVAVFTDCTGTPELSVVPNEGAFAA